MKHLNVPYTVGEPEHWCPSDLAEYEPYLQPSNTPEVVFDAVWQMAKELFPDDTAKAESWVKEQVQRYAVAEAKSQAASIAQSPVFWIFLGIGAGWLFNRSKRR